MLSYLHGFHAGNHADVLKHSILALLLSRLAQKNRPLTYMDSHAGSGYYDLNSERSQKTGEAATGILRILGKNGVPDLLARYIDLCEKLYAANNRYPGSPAVAMALTRPDDELILMELHPTEYEQLKNAMQSEKRAHVHHRDGFSGLVALSPPVHRRGLVLIDPSYETDDDYHKVAATVSSLAKRWPEAIISIWYPLVSRRNDSTRILKKAVSGCSKSGTYCAELCPAGISDNEWGLYGSGMMIVNPPWKIDEDIDQCLPWLAESLAVDTRIQAEHGLLP